MPELAIPWFAALLFGLVLLFLGIGLFVLLRACRRLRASNAGLRARLKALNEETASLIDVNRQRCEELMRSAKAGFVDWDLLSAEARAGGAWAAMLGYRQQPAEQLRPASESWLQLCHPRDRPRTLRLMRELVAGQRERMNCELRLRSARGYWHWVRINAKTTEWDAQGKPRRVLATQVDINRIKRTEQLMNAEQRLFAAGPVIVLSFGADPPHRMHQASSNFQTACGNPAQPLDPRQQPLDKLLHPDDAAALAASARKALNQPGKQAQCEVRLTRGDGGWHWYLLRVVSDRPCRGALLRAYLVDVNSLKEADSNTAVHNATLQELVRKMSETQRFMTALQQLTELLQLCDNDDESRQIIEQGGMQLFPRWNGALTFADAEGLMSVGASWGEPFTPSNSNEADCWAVRRGRLHQHNAEPSANTLSLVCGHFGGGQTLPPGIKHAICAPLLMSFDQPGALHLISHQALSEEDLQTAAWGAETLANALKLSLGNLRLRTSLREQAVRDVMTELYNRRYFDEVLSREVSRSQRTGDGLILAILDIDHFKTFNDSFGHEAGDQVLKTVAEQMHKFVRSYDVACRVGGEELAIIMPRVQMDEARARLDQLREEISANELTHNATQLPAVTVSIGVADLDSGAPDDLLRRADIALYAAKHGGRNRVICWEPSLEAASFGAFGRDRQ